MADEQTPAQEEPQQPAQTSEQQLSESEQPPPLVPPPDQPLPKVSVEERLERDLNLEPRTREARTAQANESFTAPDSLGREDQVEPTIDFSGIEAIAKESFFIADDIGKPTYAQIDEKTFSILYRSDDSIVTVRIEARPGKFGGVGFKPFSDQERKLSNESFKRRKALWQQILDGQKERNEGLKQAPQAQPTFNALS
jgi:hypothetical protein